MSIKYSETHSVYTCTKCNKIIVIEQNDQPPDECGFCDNKDPWLYPNAIVELIYNKYERKTVRYTGQKIDTDYCVRGTPWEYVHHLVQMIDIDNGGTVFYHLCEGSCLDSFYWTTCPKSLMSKDCSTIKTYSRPEWTKHLPGVES